MIRCCCCLAALALAGPVRADDKDNTGGSENKPAQLRVEVHPAALLDVDGHRTASGGEVRLFESPKLEPGKPYHYKLTATWIAGGRLAVAEATVSVRAGKESAVELRTPTSYREMVATGPPVLSRPPGITPKPGPVETLPTPGTGAPRAVALTTYPVTGRLLIDGQAGRKAILTFYPADPAVTVRPTATVTEFGTFTVNTPQFGEAAAGAPAGIYIVTVIWPKGSGVAENVLPAVYASPQTSPLRVTVRPGGTNDLGPIEIKTR